MPDQYCDGFEILSIGVLQLELWEDILIPVPNLSYSMYLCKTLAASQDMIELYVTITASPPPQQMPVT